MLRTQPKWPTWSVLFMRAALLLLGLLALALIGRIAAARAAPPTPIETVEPPPAAVAPPLADAGAGPDGSAPCEPGQSPLLAITPRLSTARATPDDPVYLNYASVEQLQRLPGIGKKRAQGIVDLRAKLGRFQRVEELMRVKGVGRATVRKLRPLVRLDMPEGGAL